MDELHKILADDVLTGQLKLYQFHEQTLFKSAIENIKEIEQAQLSKIIEAELLAKDKFFQNALNIFKCREIITNLKEQVNGPN